MYFKQQTRIGRECTRTVKKFVSREIVLNLRLRLSVSFVVVNEVALYSLEPTLSSRLFHGDFLRKIDVRWDIFFSFGYFLYFFLFSVKMRGKFGCDTKPFLFFWINKIKWWHGFQVSYPVVTCTIVRIRVVGLSRCCTSVTWRFLISW